MEIYKNKASGKYFIYIEEVNDNKGLFVTPPDEEGNARVISLEFELFDDDPPEDNAEKLLADGIIEEEQIKKYHEYKEGNSKEDKEWLDSIMKEIEEGKWPLHELSERKKKEFWKRVLNLDHIDGCAECGANKGKPIDTIVKKIKEGMFMRQNNKMVCKKHTAKKIK